MLASQQQGETSQHQQQQRDVEGEPEVNIHELRRFVQQQADTIEGLHLAAGKYKNRLDIVEKEVLEKDSEIGSLSVLTQENAMLREEILSLRESLRRLEQSTSRVIDKTTLGQESQAQLGVRVQAYQRHNAYLQGELSEKERNVSRLNERIDLMEEENQTKDRRIAIMLEKLRQHNIDPSSSVASVRIPEETYATMKVKLVSQASTVELLHEKIDSLSDEVTRKQSVMDAMKRENIALRTSVTKLIDQLTGQASVILDEGEPSVLRHPGGVRFGDEGALTPSAGSNNTNGQQHIYGSPLPSTPNMGPSSSGPLTPRSALKKPNYSSMGTITNGGAGASPSTAVTSSSYSPVPTSMGGGGGGSTMALNGAQDRSAAARRLEAYRLAKSQQ